MAASASPVECDNALTQIRAAWERFLNGQVDEVHDGVRPLIVERWLNCKRYGISPRMDRAPTHLEQTALQEIARTSPLARAGIRVLKNFAHVAESTGHTIVLADDQGRILAQAGDNRVTAAAERLNFCPGGMWDEKVVGPNGIGTAISTAGPILVIGPEHFCEQWHPWACYGSPVRDPNTRRLLGVVDLSGPVAAEVSRRSVSAFASSLARCIEAELVSESLRRRQTLREKFAEAIQRWPSEGVVVLDEAGRVTELSPRAVELIGCDFHLTLGQRMDLMLPGIGALLRRSFSTGAPGEISIAHANGSLRVYCAPLTCDGRVAGVLTVMTPGHSTGRREHMGAERARAHARTAPGGMARFSDILGTSDAIRAAICQGKNATRSDRTVLLVGESGTGKELFAQAIHAEGPRAAGSFIAVNCAAIPRELFESELFGYARGAFTSARADGAIGKFEAANGGTLFLDEISAMPLDLQTKLLRVLETNTLTRLGSHSPVPVDVRVIAAANEDFRALIKQGRFRLDLFYRLNVLSIRCPALRERVADVPILARFFLAQEAANLRQQAPDLSAELETFLRAYEWPGNVRELKNLCARWALIADANRTLTLEHVPDDMRHGARPPASAIRRRMDSELTMGTLKQMRYNVAATARALGISRTALYQRLKRAGWSPRCGKDT
jgi:sigma-54 dependent transcriptional regulator, acetoin dehydrogenase operon transcriptional activator AcoR